MVDADVLYGGTTRALLLYLDHGGVIRVRWSALLLVETSRALFKTGRLTREAANRTLDLMARAAPDADVPVHDVQRAFRRAWPGVRDAKDLHVAACAVVARDRAHAAAGVGATDVVHLITKNAKDFAPKKLALLGIRQQHPDAFLYDLWQRDQRGMTSAFAAFCADLPRRPERSRVLQMLANDGQRRTAAAMGVRGTRGGRPLSVAGEVASALPHLRVLRALAASGSRPVQRRLLPAKSGRSGTPSGMSTVAHLTER